MAPKVTIVEVGPRDGLQNISEHLPVELKLEMIQRLHKTGLGFVELTSVVSPRAVPQLKDYSQLLGHAWTQSLLRSGKGRYPVLIPNLKGLQRAQEYGVRDIAVFVSASEGFSRANTNRTVAQGIATSAQVAAAAIKSNMAVRGYLSCIFADPYDGPTPKQSVLSGVKALLEMGCYEVSLGDTLGVGSPRQVRGLLEFLLENGIPAAKLAGHFHDTYGQALSNVWEAYQCGIRVFDSSVAGLGGCPFAPGAKGNAATEDVVCMFEQAGVDTGVDLPALVEVGDWISERLSIPNGSRAGMTLAQETRSAKQLKRSKSTAGITLSWQSLRELGDVLMHRSGINVKLTMSRPKQTNWLASSMIDDLTSGFQQATRNPGISRIVLAGEEKQSAPD